MRDYILWYIIALASAIAFQRVVIRLMRRFGMEPKAKQESAPKQYLVSEQDSTLKFIARRFYPVYRPDDTLNLIYRACFKLTFFPVLVLGFVYYFFLGKEFLPPHHNAVGCAFELALAVSVLIFLLYERYIPDSMYQDIKTGIKDGLIPIVMLIPIFFTMYLDKVLLGNPKVTAVNLSLLVLYAYSVAISSMAMTRVLIGTRYMFFEDYRRDK